MAYQMDTDLKVLKKYIFRDCWETWFVNLYIISNLGVSISVKSRLLHINLPHFK